MKQHFGICEWSLPVSGPLAMQIAKEAGYEGMQIGEAGGRKMGYPLNNKRVQEIYLQTSKELGLTLHSLNLGALLSEGDINFAPGSERGEYARTSLRKGFEACERMDIHTVVITLDPKDDESFTNTIENMKLAEELAKKTNVEIAVESALPFENIQKLMSSLGAETKICMDLLNPLRFGTGNPQEQIRAFGKDKISHFHMKDSSKDLFVLGQRGCTLLGQGDAGIKESVSIINELGYEGWLITENYYYLPPMNNGDEDFVALAAEDLKIMKTL